MSDTYTIPELVRSLHRLEKSSERVETQINKLADSAVTHADMHEHTEGLNNRVTNLEENQKWLARLIVSAVLVALLGLVIAALAVIPH